MQSCRGKNDRASYTTLRGVFYIFNNSCGENPCILTISSCICCLLHDEKWNRSTIISLQGLKYKDVNLTDNQYLSNIYELPRSFTNREAATEIASYCLSQLNVTSCTTSATSAFLLLNISN